MEGLINHRLVSADIDKKNRNMCNLGEPLLLSYIHEDRPPENEVKYCVNTTSIAKEDYARYLIWITVINLSYQSRWISRTNLFPRPAGAKIP